MADLILANVKICQYTARTTSYDRVYLANDNVVRYNVLSVHFREYNDGARYESWKIEFY